MLRKKAYVVKNMKYLTVFLTMSIVFSCNIIQSTEEIEIFIPEVIPEIIGNNEYYWVLCQPGSKGFTDEIEIEKGISSFFITVEKGLIYPISLYAVVDFGKDNSFRIYPAGFIYPYSEEMNWNLGFESNIFLKLNNIIDINSINYERLNKSVQEISEGKPWILDSELIYENLVSASFRIYDIRLKSKRIVNLTIPEGVWYSEFIFNKPIISISSLIPIEHELYVGYNRFCRTDGKKLEIDLNKDGSYTFIIY